MPAQSDSERLLLVENQVIEIKKQVEDGLKRIREIEQVDATQSNDILHIKNDMKSANGKLDKILEKVSEDRGGKSYLKWFLGIAGSIVALALGYEKLGKGL